MVKFINRGREIEFLRKKYESNKAELIVLYGRRRIGKTELLSQFSRENRALYFLGRLESKKDTIKRFNHSLIEYFQDTELLSAPLSSWDGIFQYLGEKVTSRCVIILDEFPFLVEKFPEIVSVLQDRWDSLLKNTKVMFIICGSSVGMMEKYALDYTSPLYGRRTGQWKVDKFRVGHLREFFSDYNMEDLMAVYSCLDTIPGYLVHFSPAADVWTNIREKILSKGEFLYDEVEILLREELRDPSNYMSILSAISGGTTTFNEIYTRTQLDKSMLSKYLHILGNLGIVEKILPVTEGYKSRLKAKGALYFLKDNFFDFWFRFVYLYKQQLEEGKTEIVLERIRKDSPRYLSRKFETFVGEIIPRLDIMDVTMLGKWWHRDSEIDLVALNERTRECLFCECKWSKGIDCERIVKALSAKTDNVKWFNEDRKESYAVFAKSFKKRMDEYDGKRVFCFDLADLERARV